MFIIGFVSVMLMTIRYLVLLIFLVYLVKQMCYEYSGIFHQLQ